MTRVSKQSTGSVGIHIGHTFTPEDRVLLRELTQVLALAVERGQNKVAVTIAESMRRMFGIENTTISNNSIHQGAAP